MFHKSIVVPAVLAFFITGCGANVATHPKIEGGETVQRETIPVPKVRFTDVTQAAGIRFVHTNGSFGKKLLPETMGSGVAFIDFDRDGKQDLLFVNSCYWPGHEEPGKKPTLALYRNVSTPGHVAYEDVTAKMGLDVTMFGMGVTVGDFDNDGWPDIFVTGVGGNRLFRNVEGKRFEDVTMPAGVGGPGGWPTGGDFLKHDKPINWSSSAAWLDYDGDGWLDLFVCNYVVWSPDYDLKLESSLKGAKDRAFGPPVAFSGSQCFLYHNERNGTFVEMSQKEWFKLTARSLTSLRAAEVPQAVVEKLNPLKDEKFISREHFQVALAKVLDAEELKRFQDGILKQARETVGVLVSEQLADGVPRPVGKSLGVIVADVDEDGWPDIIVANDTVRNFFFHNKGDGTFEEKGQSCGVAYAEGRARGAMGMDIGEYRPGKCAVVISNFADEPTTFLRLDNPKRLAFADAALAEGLAGPSRPLLKFGTFFFDYDLDGRLDLLTCNGHLEPEIAKVQPGQRYAQPAQLFWNTGQKQRFEPVTAEAAGPDLFQPIVGRGSAFADIDGDGYLDVVLTNNGGAPLLLRNEGGTGHHWLRLVLEGDGLHSNKSAIGARITVEAGAPIQHREVTSARGYLSQSELPVTFGLGQETKIDKVTIRWPGKGAGETVLTDVKVDAVRTVVQGK